jgi:hypothetical protein
MGSGRTKPAIFACEDRSGNPAGDYVVKFSGGIESGVVGLSCELISALVAAHLGLATPPPAIVEVNTEIAQILPNQDGDLAAIIQRSWLLALRSS